MRTPRALLAAISVSLLALNVLGGLIGGIWLATAGQWSTIALGILILVVAAHAVSIFLAPALGLAGAGTIALDRGNKGLGWFLLISSVPWVIAVILAWEVAIFLWFRSRVTSSAVAVPMWLWSYCVATGAWSYRASRGSQSDDIRTAVALVPASQVAYVVLTICHAWLGWRLSSTIIAMTVPLVLPISFGLRWIAKLSSSSRI